MMNYDHPYGTFCAEPSCEDAWDDSDLTFQEQPNTIFEHAAEQYREDLYRDSDAGDYSYADGYER